MSAPHVSAMAALVAQAYPHLNQAGMEAILKQAARGNPLAADGAFVGFPFEAPGYYYQGWNGGDYGAGFLQADQALATAAIFA